MTYLRSHHQFSESILLMTESEATKSPTPLPLPAMQERRSSKLHVVALPPVNFISCDELAQQIADALDRWRSNGRSGYPARRVAWSDAAAADSPYPRSKAARMLVQHLRQYRGAPYSARWDPSMVSLKESDPHLDAWLNEVGRRTRDLQAWVDRGEIAIFDSNWVKCRRVGYDTYVKRPDAVRYCQQSGLEVAEHQPATSGTRSNPAAASDSMIGPEPLLPQNAATPQTASQPHILSAAPSDDSEKTNAPAPRGTMLRPKVAMVRTGLARSTFYERQNPKSRYFDPSFPKARSLGEGSVGYLETEIDRWIAARPAARR
ncbi:AlpA family phage regulatory protein [Variovorax sp. H27-G14]|uniref:helix-turn-helix transcriptional regulator n=1 Tax=Variovorax sp. H27-G14 TaxID=3111914 RepID=UPI0038FC717C